MAPEVFKHRKYDKKVDVFSFGMILYEVIGWFPLQLVIRRYTIFVKIHCFP